MAWSQGVPLGHFVEVLLGEQVAEGSVLFRHHLFERLSRLFGVRGRSEIVGMVYGAQDDLFVHPYGEDGVPLLEFFVPLIIGIRVGQTKRVARTSASPE